MSNKSIDEIAAELTIAMMEHNAKLQHANGTSYSKLINATHISMDFQYFREVIAGNINPLKKNKKDE